MEGPLSKWTNLVNGWQYRWFVLDSKNGFLIYYTSRDKMKRGSCRGVIHLKNAMIGIDDEDDSGFSITSDTKQFHFQARDILEREKWVKALEYAICMQRSKDESKSEIDKSVYANQEDNFGENTFTLQQNEKFDAKIAEADAYLQILIAQVKKLEAKIEEMNEDDEIYKKYVEIKISTHALIDSVKHSIVIMQITRNALYPTCGIYHSSLPPLILESPSMETNPHEKKTSFKEELLSNNAPISLALSASIPSIESDDRSKSLSLSSLRNTPPSSIWSSTEVVMPSSIINNNISNGIKHTQSSGKENTPLSVDETLLIKNQNIQRSRSLSFSDTEDSLHFYDALNISSHNNHPIINQSNEQSSDLIYDTTEIAEKSPSENVLLDTDISKNQEINPTIEKSKSENAIFDENCLFELSKSDLEESEDLTQYGSMIKHLLSQVRIGMDLTKVTLPTFILERRSLLEMFADFFAHASTFCGIVEHKTAQERMTQVVKYYLSSFHSGRQSSVAKKPFNPILGEVFMCHWKSSVQNGSETINMLDSNQDCNLSFVAEQVSHHPPISAFYAENTEKRICINGNIWTKSKFLGLSIGVHMVGQAYIKLLDFDEEYVCTFPNAYARSIFSVPWMELGGKVTITCSKTGYFADIEFLTKPFYGGTKHQIIGQIFGPFDKSPYLTITGAWNGIMQAKTNKGDAFEFVNTETLEQQTKVVDPIAQQKDYESRKIWLNVAKHLKAHELELATQEKRNIEEKQRLNARHRSVSGLKWECKFFEEINGYWMYRNALTKQKRQPN